MRDTLLRPREDETVAEPHVLFQDVVPYDLPSSLRAFRGPASELWADLRLPVRCRPTWEIAFPELAA